MFNPLCITAFALAVFDSMAAGQEPDGDAWYYERIAVQEPPVSKVEEVPESWQDSWNPFVRRLRIEIRSLVERERELPRLRFELQGDRSNKFALFRCLDDHQTFSVTWDSEEAIPVHDVFLLPTRIPQADGTVRTLGFPVQSRIELSASGDFDDETRTFEVPALHEGSLEGFPIRVPLDGGEARSIRWVISEPFAPFGIGYLAVSEVFIISGDLNVAPHGTLRWSEGFLPDRSMVPGFLKDEKTPLGLPLIREETAVLGYHSEIKETSAVDEEWIELTWDEPREVGAIRLIPAQQRVLPHTETFGFPLAHQTDFFEGEENLRSHRVQYAIDPGQNVVTVPGVERRKVDRVRWTATELWQRRDSRFLSLAEVQALDSRGRNVAGEATIKVSSAGIDNKIWNLEALTDDLASEGRLVPFGEWLRGLEESRRLRMRRLASQASLERAIQGMNEALLIALIAGLSLVAVGFALSSRKERIRAQTQSAEFRRQLASDLHDDLGGNLGSIVLLTEQVRGGENLPTVSGEDLERVVELARDSRHQLRTILEVSDESRGQSLDLETFVRRLRLTVRDFFGEEHGYLTLPDDEGESLGRLSEKQRGEILLFCKEALHNLSQHGDASCVLVQLDESGNGVCLKIEDNSSIPLVKEGGLRSRSLRRRSRKLAGNVRAEQLPEGRGNLLVLELPCGGAA